MGMLDGVRDVFGFGLGAIKTLGVSCSCVNGKEGRRMRTRKVSRDGGRRPRAWRGWVVSGAAPSNVAAVLQLTCRGDYGA